jgi:hypothetical protein
MWRLYMYRVAVALVVASLFLSIRSAVAADADPGWVVGVGRHSCGSFLAALREHEPNGEGYHMQGSMYVSESELFQQWIWGYVTAHFRYGLSAKGDGPGITQWVAHWCESHGDDTVLSAAGAYIAHAMKR